MWWVGTGNPTLFLTSAAVSTPNNPHYFSENLVVSGFEPGPLDLWTYSQEL
jgi:hypothetical protein